MAKLIAKDDVKGERTNDRQKNITIDKNPLI